MAAYFHCVVRFVVASFWVLSWFADLVPVFERSFDLHDPLISHPHGKDQYVIHFSRLSLTASTMQNSLELVPV